ncbi:MAG: PilZ domain-containing protein [Bryobacteraceae bacterium]
MVQSKEHRRNPRFVFTSPVGMSWQDGQGRYRTSQAKGVDICETGAQVELTEAVEPHSPVTIRSEKHRLSASATVRYCQRRGPRFRIGIEFTGGCRWRTPGETSPPGSLVLA